ncbi:hypothetical protein [Romboutsia sp.]|uniref:hypothetical protein n=1 Tax=Romboutsia sp. TaxID=1965302 RepID=UPI003F2FA97D
MVEMVKYPYNVRSIARLDSDNVVHNHIYHNCPVGKVDENGVIYNKINYPIGRVDENGVIHNDPIHNNPIGKVDENGFVYDNKSIIARMDGDNTFTAGSAYLLLIHGTR